MTIRTQEHIADDKKMVVCYQICLSAKETAAWARKPGASWPCSILAGHRLYAFVDSNGLFDLAIDGIYPDNPDIGASGELEACIADHLPTNCQHLWPTWEKVPA